MAARESLFYNEVQNYSLLKVGQQNDDRLSELPKEILLLIISNLTMNEVGRFGLVSRQYGFIWRCVPVLIFEDSQIIQKFSPSRLMMGENIIDEERARFVSRVNHVIENYLETSIDELRITCDLDHNWQSHVDNWAAFALDKKVKRLEFNFTSSWRHVSVRNLHGVLLRVCGDPLNLPPAFMVCKSKSSLSSLCLKYVNVTDDFVNRLFHGYPLLENLCIVGSKCLTRICGSLQVKRLKVSECLNLKRINICATKLQSFILRSDQPIELHIEGASSLLEMSIGTRIIEDGFAYVFASLSDYFSQLVYLSLWIPYLIRMKMRIGNGYFVPMPNLQHLEFQVVTSRDSKSLEELTSVMAVCPSIQKLTLKLETCTQDLKHEQPVEKWDGFPLKCLKTLEIIGYVGWPMDLELAYFVFENAIMLEEVIIDFISRKCPNLDDKAKKERLQLLQAKLPQHVKFTVK